MSAYNFAVICLRVLSVYFVFQVIVQIPMAIVGLNQILTVSTDEAIDVNYKMMLLQGTYPFVMSLLFALIIWFLAPFIARKILKIPADQIDTADLANKNDLIKLNRVTLQATAISTVGFLLLAISLPQLVASLIGVFKFPLPEFYSREQNPYFDQVLIRSLQVFAGILLILGMNFWVQLLNKLRQFGLSKKAIK